MIERMVGQGSARGLIWGLSGSVQWFVSSNVSRH